MEPMESDVLPLGGTDQTAAQLAPRIAAGITTVILLAFGFVAVTYLMAADHSPVLLAEALGLLAVVLALQFCISFPGLLPRLAPRLGARLGRRAWRLLLLQALLTFVPLLQFGQAWLPLPGLLAGSALLVLRDARQGWGAFAAIVLSTDVLQFGIGLGWRDISYTTVSTILTGLVVFALSRLTGMVGEVHRSRAELAQFAVTQERLRFARDLHDLLGYSLSTITLKCELAYRLTPVAADQARQEISEVLDISRQALADVRAVAHGYRKMSLRTEVCDAQAMLAVLGVQAKVNVAYETLPAEVDTVLATVFREGLTNILRHSAVKRCEIETGRRGDAVWFRLANDGVVRAASARGSHEGGSGIENLTFRVKRLGGHLTVGVADNGWFELRLEVPLNGVGATPTTVRP
ncbi:MULTISPECIES: sensor histidine kinase [Streptomyces]|uniref:Histidine kinase n=2 Tax=Streptomyces TaxID=1883 RepID=A0ABS9J9N3_9ACTN|nr:MULTISPECIES: histidine kinase [Streptomyces]MCG0062277.1 histidine kinase [Streptomyces tricolor]MYU27729.1 sensor histidine kinase [Streptomyces sp. SID7810]CUW26593.1 Sensor histidine kinase DesK [Streptomyces reticuli]